MIVINLPFPHRKIKGGRDKILTGMVLKANIGELEEEVRVGSSRRIGNDLAGVV